MNPQLRVCMYVYAWPMDWHQVIHSFEELVFVYVLLALGNRRVPGSSSIIGSVRFGVLF